MARKPFLILIAALCISSFLVFTPKVFSQDIPSTDLDTGLGGYQDALGGSSFTDLADMFSDFFSGGMQTYEGTDPSITGLDGGTVDAASDTTVDDKGETRGKVPASAPDPSNITTCVGGNPSAISWQPSLNASYYNVWRTDLSGTPTQGTGLIGQYFDGDDLTTPMMTRIDPPAGQTTFSFDWGAGAPDPKISPESFSVKWIGKFKAKADGLYRFWVSHNDGVLLYIEDELVINKNNNTSGVETDSGVYNTQLVANQLYNIRLEYKEKKDNASISLSWEVGRDQDGSFVTTIPTELVPATALFPGFSNGVNMKLLNNTPITESTKPILYTDASGNGTGLFAQYFDNTQLKAPTAKFKIDPPSDFFDFSSWATQLPDPLIDSSTYSVIWGGKIKAPSTGTFTFYVNAKDGIILSIADDTNKMYRILGDEVNTWKDQPLSERTGTYPMIKDQMYDIKLKHYLKGGDGTVQLSWSCTTGCSPNIPKQLVPKINLYNPININFNPGVFTQYFDNDNIIAAADALGSPTAAKPTLTSPGSFDLDWGANAPDPSIGTDNFSIRWSGMLKVPEAGAYKFYVTTQAAFELKISTNAETSVVKNAGFDASAPTKDGNISFPMGAGEFYKFQLSAAFGTGNAKMKLAWQTPSMITAGQPPVAIPLSQFTHHETLLNTTLGPGTSGKFFDNKKLNAQTITRIDGTIDHTQPPWSTPRPTSQPQVIPAPDPVINNTTFSIRWVGKITAPETGEYTVQALDNDGALVSIGVGSKLKRTKDWNDYNGSPPGYRITPVTKLDMVAGRTYDIRVEYYFNTPDSANPPDYPYIKLQWIKPSGTTELIPASAFSHGLVSSTLLNYNDTTAVPGQLYYYQLSAVGAAGNIFSSWVSNFALTCANPTITTSNALCSGDVPKVDLAWTQNINATEYRVYRSDNSSVPVFTAVSGSPEFTSRTWTDTTVSRNFAYSYAVVSYNPLTGEIPISTWYPISDTQTSDANFGTNKTPWCDSTAPSASFNFIFASDQCYTPASWVLSPPQPIQATATDAVSGVKSVTFRLSQCLNADCSSIGSSAQYPASQPDPIGNPNLWQKTFNGSGDLDILGGTGKKYKLELQAKDNNNNPFPVPPDEWTDPKIFRYAVSCVKDWIKTSGGDVHSNENIDTVGGP